MRVSSIEFLKKKYNGLDNYGSPSFEFVQELLKMDDSELRDECERFIWLSAYANNNPRSDYHWKADACYDVCSFLGKRKIYELAYKSVSSQV